MEQRTLVFVGAHPDDETFGIGGTLAHYAQKGVRVYYIVGTRGEAGSTDPERLKGFASMGELRWSELQCAAGILGLADVIHLGYRDSGMPGSEDNKHPQALVATPVEQVAGRVVKELRRLKPQVVITFDPIGGYRHPDHIAMHNAAVMAFDAAGDPRRYPDEGAPYQPHKLYFSVFSRRLLRLAVRVMPLFGKDPHRFGRNRDIDLAGLTNVHFPIHAAVRLTRKAVSARDNAMACHASQVAGGPPFSGLFKVYHGFFGQRDFFMRAYPVPSGRRIETDLFEGIV